MNIGAALLDVATVALIGAVVARWSSMKSKDKRMSEASAVLSMVAFGAITASLVLLMDYFLTSDMSYRYVWMNSSTDLSSTYKLSGVWAGAQGSFLLWIWFMSLVLAVEVLLEPKRKYLSRRYHSVFQIALAGVLFAFMLILLDMNLFARTDPVILSYVPNGRGMTLVLQTPEMVVHPPVVFAGYAFCIGALAAGLAYFIAEEKNWFKIALPWTRLGWIFLTLGIGIGAIWAYYVLGWGGYWAWDPVETSSLLPWLIATAFLHTLVRNAKKDEYNLAAPALGMLTFVSVVFATFATRAGSLWTSSVHNFGTSVGTSGAARLGYILNHDSTVLGIFTLLLALLAATLMLTYSKYRAREPAEESPEPEQVSEYISDKNTLLLTVIILVVLSAVMVLLLFKNVNVSQGANYAEFNQKLSIFFVGLMATMSVCMIWKFIGKRPAFMLGSGLIAASIVLGVVALVTGALDGLVAFSLPTYAVAIGASAFKLGKSGVAGSLRKTLQSASPHVIHVGVALVLLAFVVSSNMQAFPKNSEIVSGARGNQLSLGDQLNVSGYTVRLVSLEYTTENRMVGMTIVYTAVHATLEVSGSGGSERLTLTNLLGISNEKPSVVKADVHIHKSVLSDLYLNFQWLTNTTAFVQAKAVPLMNFLWGGFGLLVVGLALRTVTWRFDAKEFASPSPTRKSKAQTAKPGARDYEAVVEEELKKFKEKKNKKSS